MVVKVAAFVRTNVTAIAIHKDFIGKLADELVKEFFTEKQHVTVDIQSDCLMVRGGSSAPMAIVQLYHNDDRVDDHTKAQYAERLASFISHDVLIDKARILVLFHDTRKCS